MAYTLASLPPSILSLITRLLSFESTVNLIQLSGCPQLSRCGFEYGGVTEVAIQSLNSQLSFRLSFPLIPSFAHLRSFRLNFGVERFALPSGWLLLLPRQLAELKIKAEGGSSSLLRPLNRDQDSVILQYAISMERNQVPIEFDLHFPHLRMLHIHNGVPETVWSMEACSHFLSHLPSSLTYLKLSWADLSHRLLNTHPETLLPKTLTQLQRFAWRSDVPTNDRPYDDDVYGNIPDFRLSAMQDFAQTLTTLDLKEMVVEDVSLLAKFEVLTKFCCKFANGDPFKDLPDALPPTLTHLELASAYLCKTLEFSILLRRVPDLLHLRLEGVDDDMGSYKVDYLPPSLTVLYLQSHSKVQLLAPLPTSLKDFTFHNANDRSTNCLDLRALDHLTYLSIDLPLERVQFPASSLFHLVLQTHFLSITDLSKIPKNLTGLNAQMDLTVADADLPFFDDFNTWSRTDLLERIRATYLPNIKKEKFSVILYANTGVTEAILGRNDRFGRLTSWAPHGFEENALSSCLSGGKSLPSSLTILSTDWGEVTHMSVPHLPPKLVNLELAGDCAWSVGGTRLEEMTGKLHPRTREALLIPAEFALHAHQRRPTLVIPYSEAIAMSHHQLPKTLELVSLTTPQLISGSVLEGKAQLYIYPFLQTAPLLTTLHLSEMPEIAPSFLEGLPETLTELIIHFGYDTELDMHLPASDKCLPNLKKLTMTPCRFSLRSTLPRLAAFKYLHIGPRIGVHSDILPPFDEQETVIDDEAITRHLLKRLIPPHLRQYFQHSQFFIEWNASTFQKLPPKLRWLELDLGNQSFFGDAVNAVPPLNLADLSCIHLEGLHIMGHEGRLKEQGGRLPSSLKHVTFELHGDVSLFNYLPTDLDTLEVTLQGWNLIGPAFRNLPPRLQHLLIYKAESEMMPFTSRLPQCLKSLQILASPYPSDGIELLEVLPKSLTALVIDSLLVDHEDGSADIGESVAKNLPNLVLFSNCNDILLEFP